MRRLGRAIRRTPLLADLPREVAVLATIAFFVALGFGILIPSLPIFASTFGVNAFQAGLVISAFALVRFVTSPLAGILVNRWGERSVLSSGLLIVALSSLVAGFSQSYGQLLVLRGAGGLGSSMFTVSAMALLLRVTSSQQRGRASSAFHGGFLFGGVAGPAVGGLVVAWSIRAPFFVYAVTLLVATAVSLIFLSRVRLHEREEVTAESNTNKREELRTALKNPAYQAAIGSNLITGFVIFGLRASIVPLF
ncbi:MAG: MFS transporter, partial [Actinomycetota bacterium]|nr:MFS transporter [Actinomycetota bacterium]